MSKIPVDPKFGPGTLIQRLTDLWRQLATSHNNNDTTLSGHVGAGGSAHANATTSTAGFMSAADKTLADGWFPNWTSASKTAVIRSVSSDSTLTLTSTVAGSAASITTAATTGTTVSGNIVIQPGSSQNVQPGYVHIKGADTTGTAALSHGGDVELFGGLGRRVGGSVRLFGGDTTNTGAGLSLGGAFELYGGNGYKTGGPANIIGGSVTGPTGVGGYVVLKPGTGAGAGTDGTVDVQDAYNNVVIQVGTVALGGASALGFFAFAPVAQQTATAAGGFVNGGGAAVNQGFTSTGGVGATAYTFNDVVAALKNYGLLVN